MVIAVLSILATTMVGAFAFVDSVQAEGMHCDSMKRATMYGYKIPKKAPCLDFNTGIFYKSYYDYCRANKYTGSPGCRHENFEY